MLLQIVNMCLFHCVLLPTKLGFGGQAVKTLQLNTFQPWQQHVRIVICIRRFEVFGKYFH